MLTAVLPAENYNAPANTITRRKLDFVPPVPFDVLPYISNFKFPIFSIDDDYYVLIKDVVSLCNYPSSYQLLNKLFRRSQLEKSSILTSTQLLNQQLLDQTLIEASQVSTKLFYIPLPLLCSIVNNKFLIIDHDDFPETPTEPESPLPYPANDIGPANNDDKIIISQVFPQYGLVESTLPLNHSSFNTLNNLTKINYYKINGHFRKIMGPSLNAAEREQLYKDNNFAEIEVVDEDNDDDTFNAGNTNNNTPKMGTPSTSVKNDDEITESQRRFRKPIGKPKKNNTNIDPNSIDLAESILPGQGLIQEFNISHICKVPNYFITTNHMNAAQTSAISNYKKPAASALFNENIKMSRNIQQLVFNNDNDAYHHSKYYYFKSYRGPGSGNYKDAALVNRINKIHLVSHPLQVKGGNHKTLKKVRAKFSGRPNQSIKGLLHDFFDKNNVDIVLDQQRRYTEDYHNVEMLHNNLQFNLLVNTYREISEETWDRYYTFKMTDFEQLNEIQRLKIKESKRKEMTLKHQQNQQKFKEELEANGSVKVNQALPISGALADLYKPDLSSRFTLPSTYREIIQKLPVEFRDDEAAKSVRENDFDEDGVLGEVPSIKRPIYYSTASSEYANPEHLNKIEVVKLPNANSIAWDNFRKYRAWLKLYYFF